ncbi:MAG: VTT domain-containing protein [Burkholderiales bacterium]|nr:VTT domain-containing protein [Burkholderiales bacterium]
MSDLAAALGHYGVGLVFVNVLLTQLGAPLPAVPVMIVAGAVAAGGHMSGWQAFAVAVIASSIADALWYAAGRRYGHRVLAALCRMSLSPASCVRQTERVFLRYGLGTVVIAKFVPGLATITPPLAGAIGLRPATFLVFNAVGAALWAGGSLLAGWLLADQIDAAIAWMAHMGGYAIAVLALLLAVYMSVKWFERHRFLAQLRAARIAVAELHAMIEGGEQPLILDVRSAAALGVDRGRIPRAVLIDPDAPDAALGDLPRDRDIIVYCS